MSVSRRCSSADFENMREKNYENLFAAGRSVKNVPRHWRQFNFNHANLSLLAAYTSQGL